MQETRQTFRKPYSSYCLPNYLKYTPNSLMKMVKISTPWYTRDVKCTATPFTIKAQNKFMAYQNRGKRSEKEQIYLISCLPCTKMPIKCVLSLNGQCYVQTLYDFWSVSRSSNRILLQPFDCVFVSCKLICGIEWPLRVTMLFLYPTPYPFKDGSHGENECSNSLTRDGTNIIDLFCYQKLG